MGRIVVLLATLVCGFRDGNDETIRLKLEDQFAKLQCYYEHERQRFQTLTDRDHDAETAAAMVGSSVCQGSTAAMLPLRLSPRMVIESAHTRTELKQFFENVLFDQRAKRAKDAEMELLHELELDENKAIKKSTKKKKHQPKKKKLQSKENLPDGRPGANVHVVADKKKDSNKTSSTFAQVVAAREETKYVDQTTTKAETGARKKAQFPKQLTNKPVKSRNDENKEGQVESILKKELSADVPNPDVVAHIMVPLKIDYKDRVSDTALPRPDKSAPELSADELRESIVPPMSPTRSRHANNSAFSALISEIESLKAENAQLRREVAAAGQNLTEAVQRVQLKAYIAETARDSAQERAALLESLLLEVLEGKIAGIELQEVLLGLKEQTTSPTAGSSLNSFLGRLPKDTQICVNSSSINKESSPLRDELQNHKGVLSQLRHGNNMNIG